MGVWVHGWHGPNFVMDGMGCMDPQNIGVGDMESMGFNFGVGGMAP